MYLYSLSAQLDLLKDEINSWTIIESFITRNLHETEAANRRAPFIPYAVTNQW